MISALPKLRTDLTVRRHQTAGGTYFVVKDPVSGNFFRFREAERFIAQQCDGDTPLDVVRRRTEEQFGATLPASTLAAFVRNLEKTGLLDTEKSRRRRPASQRGRIDGTTLYLRCRLFDPTRLFDRMLPRLRFLFTPHFLLFSSAIILLAVATAVANWREMTLGVIALFNPWAIPFYMAIIFLVVSLHELAHGATCRHFGGEVHEVGFLLVYFQPALYCNVSDAWLFPEKSKRLWVGFAGPYFELFLWALATLTWRVSDPETWINAVALIVATSSGVKTCLNFNPLLKLDGYYLLSDYLEIPNLRRRSFRHVGGLFKRLFLPSKGPRAEVTRRERLIYLVYGLAASSGSFCLLAYILATAGGRLVEGHTPAAVVLSAGYIGARFRRRFRRLFGKPSGASDPDDDGEEFESADDSSGIEDPAPEKKADRSWIRRIAWSALAAAALAVLLFGRLELRVGGPFTILPRHNADVRAAVEGIVQTILVDEGDEVRKGDVIARLFDGDMVPELRKTEAEIREARARLQMLMAGPTTAEVAVAKAAVSKAVDKLRYGQKGLLRAKTLYEKRLITQKELEETQDLASTSQNELVEEERRLTALLKRTRPEELDATKAQIERLATQQRYLEDQRRLLEVVSPASGIVATPSRQLKELTGQLVKKGDLIAKVFDLKTVTAEIAISEKEIAGIQVGQSVVLRSRSYPDLAASGTVTSIATATEGLGIEASQSGTLLGGHSSGNRTILVTTEIDNPALLFKPGMTGQAKVHCGQRRALDLVTRRMARTLKVEFWSWY